MLCLLCYTFPRVPTATPAFQTIFFYLFPFMHDVSAKFLALQVENVTLPSKRTDICVTRIPQRAERQKNRQSLL